VFFFVNSCCVSKAWGFLVLLVLLDQGMNCWKNHEQQTISMQRNVVELTCVLFVNTCTLRSRPQNPLSSSPTPRATLTRVSQGKLGGSVTRWNSLWFLFFSVVRECSLGCILTATFCILDFVRYRIILLFEELMQAILIIFTDYSFYIVHEVFVLWTYLVTCRVVRETKMTGSTSDDWIY
jgi:hypothetical protein